jgi:carboxylate-amine ligase
MDKMVFQSSPKPTLGVEIELALVDAESMALSSSILDIRKHVPDKFKNSIKPELMQCYVEINTGVCDTVTEADTDLREKAIALQGIADDLGLRLHWTGTHPFSSWQDQQPTPDERYARLLDLLQDFGRRLVTFGLHVHVGVDSGDKAVMICDRILRHLPTLLALSCNSPWWNGRSTGMQSHRSKIMDGLPTAGLPAFMRNWSEYVWLLNHLLETDFIRSIRDIWWDVRPHHNFGTVEVRSCDTLGNLDDCLTMAALIQCLVQALSDRIDEGTYQHDCHPMLVQQNKWRAARYGLDAQLVDSYTFESRSARKAVTELVDILSPTAEQLDCLPYLERARDLAAGATWADRQLKAIEETGDPAEAVRRATEASRLTTTS